MQAMERSNLISFQPHRHRDGTQVMALHCSGSDQSQWQHLGERLHHQISLILPDLAGPDAEVSGWSMSTYSLAHEAKPLIARLRQYSSPTHLVGHSYGGAVALHIAKHHPELVASLCLYEPTMFSVLNRTVSEDVDLFEEIKTLAKSIRDSIEEGYPGFAAQLFSDFWGGLGSWQALHRDRRAALTDWIPKCPLDFGALLFEPDEGYQQVKCPSTLIVGSQTQRQTKRISELLAMELSDVRLVEVEGVGHLGPFIFRDKVAEIVKEHLIRTTKQALYVEKSG